MNEDRISNYIARHPRKSLKIFIIASMFVIHSVAAVLGMMGYSLYAQRRWWTMGIVTVFVVSIGTTCISHFHRGLTLIEFTQYAFQSNLEVWKHFIFHSAYTIYFSDYFIYSVCFAAITMTLLRLTDLIPVNKHAETLDQLARGIYQPSNPELDDIKVNKLLSQIDESKFNGTVLGVSKYTGETVIIPDKHLNQVALVLGTTGTGKTITLRRFYKRAITQGNPLIIVDGKPDNDNISWVQELAIQHNRPFFGFNCANNLPYNPLSSGGHTELKDKVISLKDEWSSDHYKSIAEDYLQATFQVLLQLGKPVDLKLLVDSLNYESLVDLVRNSKDESLIKRVRSLDRYDRKDITGLQAHLSILVHSELGEFFAKTDQTFTLQDVIQHNGVAFFALPALRFPSFSKVLGKLIINDLKTQIDRNAPGKPIFTIFDEFSIFAGEQVLNLVNMGRGKGVHAIFGTQGLADLATVSPSFQSQVLNCVNTIICHRLNDQESAETVSNWVGTEDTFTVTAQLDGNQNQSGMGSVRINKEFSIHPDGIKKVLEVGEAYNVSKVGGFVKDKVKIIY